MLSFRHSFLAAKWSFHHVANQISVNAAEVMTQQNKLTLRRKTSPPPFT